VSGYWVPFGEGTAELVEKRSRFIGRVFRVSSEAEARAKIEAVKKEHYDARHNCWCCLLREGGVLRYSDDGEPQGTAGQPMLNVFQREEVFDVCCVVTRYFGGILLGAGGLVRTYSGAAKAALCAAGLSRMSLWATVLLPCTYPLFERMKLEDVLAKVDELYPEEEEQGKELEAGIDIEPKAEIEYDDFMKMQFQVGEIIACEAVAKSKKLLCSQVRIGSQVKQIVSGIRKQYSPEEMVGKKVMVLVNLKPAKLAGVLSEGMLLCAENAEGELALVVPEKEMPSGAEIC